MWAEKWQKCGFLPLLALPLNLLVLEKGVRRAGKGYNNMGYMTKKILVLLNPLSIMRLLSISIMSLSLIVFLSKTIYFK